MREQKREISEAKIKPWKVHQSEAKLASIEEIPLFGEEPFHGGLAACLFSFYVDSKAYFKPDYWAKAENGALDLELSQQILEVVASPDSWYLNLNKLLPVLIMHMLHLPRLPALIDACHPSVVQDSARTFLKAAINFLFYRAEYLITREQQLAEEQSINAQQIQNSQAHLEKLKAEYYASQQSLSLLSQKLQEEERRYTVASSGLDEVEAIIGNASLNAQNKLDGIAQVLPQVEQKPEAKKSASLASVFVEPGEPATAVPPSFLFIVKAALHVEKDQVRQMVFMMSALTPIAIEAQRAHEQVRNKTFYSWRGCQSTAESDRMEISRQLSAFSQAMVSLTPTQEQMILKANQCLRAVITTILETPDLGDLQLYYFPLLQNFIRCVTEHLFERLESLCDDVARLERIKSEDAKKMRELDTAASKQHMKLNSIALRRREELGAKIVDVQKISVTPQKYLKQITSIFRVRKSQPPDKTITAINNLLREYRAVKV